MFLPSIWNVDHFQTNSWFLLKVSHNNALVHTSSQVANIPKPLAHLSKKIWKNEWAVVTINLLEGTLNFSNKLLQLMHQISDFSEVLSHSISIALPPCMSIIKKAYVHYYRCNRVTQIQRLLAEWLYSNLQTYKFNCT